MNDKLKEVKVGGSGAFLLIVISIENENFSYWFCRFYRLLCL